MDLFWRGSSKQMNSFAFHELQVTSFFIALPHAHILLRFVCHHAILMALDWMLLADGVEKQPRTHHRPSTDKQCNILFSLVVPCHVASNSTKMDRYLMAIGLSFVLRHFVRSRAWLPGLIYCMWQYVQAISLSVVPCFSYGRDKETQIALLSV